MRKVWFISLLLQCSVTCAEPVPVILDTDVGGDIDDTWAIGMLLGCPQIDLKLIVTGSDDAPRKASLTAKILEQMGRTDIPVGIGLKTSSHPIAQDQWLGGYELDRYPGKVYQDGIQAMIEMIEAAPGPITLLLIGPQTNIREALKRRPDIAKKARVTAMAGSVEIGYNGKQGREPECNVVVDIAAARAVFDAPWEITMVPLDGCGTLILKGDHYAQVARSEAPRAKTVIENYRLWTNYKAFPDGQSSVLFDTAAVALVFKESLFDIKTIRLSIDDKGNTVPDDPGGRPIRCAMGWKNRDGFEHLLVESLLNNKR
jgi:inosine-uridine nucleoside N-ribohydrolase